VSERPPELRIFVPPAEAPLALADALAGVRISDADLEVVTCCGFSATTMSTRLVSSSQAGRARPNPYLGGGSRDHWHAPRPLAARFLPAGGSRALSFAGSWGPEAPVKGGSAALRRQQRPALVGVCGRSGRAPNCAGQHDARVTSGKDWDRASWHGARPTRVATSGELSDSRPGDLR
jgi:hypothetical protein